MIEVVRAIISPQTFLGLINSLAARVIENLAENAPPREIVYNFVIYRVKAAVKFGKIM